MEEFFKVSQISSICVYLYPGENANEFKQGRFKVMISQGSKFDRTNEKIDSFVPSPEREWSTTAAAEKEWSTALAAGN